MTRKPKDARAEWQARVSKFVWGLALIAGGVLLTLDSRGLIELGRESPFPAAHATDGDTTTRWSSRWRDGQWVTVDLGAPANVSKVRLHWEKAYARSYDLAVSDDGQKWTTVAEVRDGDGGVDEHAVSAHGRYLRMTGLERGPVQQGRKKNRYGVSLWELEVMGPGDELLSRGKVASASSVEGHHLWFVYWPLFLVIGGLPAVLAPKDGGDQMFGLLIVVIGATVQLRMLGLLKLGWWTIGPMFFILAGLLLILDGLRRPDGRDGAGTAEEAR